MTFTEKRIPKAELEMIVKAGIYAPSGHNMQTWRFIVIRNAEMIVKLKSVVKEAAARNKVYFYGFNNPDTLILVANNRRNPNSIQDSSCAAENIMLAAQSYGVGSVWINAMHMICDEPEIRELLNELGVPEQHIVWSTIALGYPLKQPKTLAKKMDVIQWIE